MRLSAVYRLSFAVSAIDLMAAAICAAKGDGQFMTFMVLAGLMYAQGLYYRAKALKRQAGE